MIEIKDIEKLAALSRLPVPTEGKEKLLSDINKILAYVGQISEAHAETAPAHVANAHGAKNKESDHQSMVFNVLREDVNPHESGIFTEKLLTAAPAREGNYLKVKKIL